VSSEADVVGWLTLGVAALGTGLTTFTSIWIGRQAAQERVHLHIDWTWDGSGPTAEYPVLYVQNRSSTAIQIAEIAWYRGFFRRKRAAYSAKWGDDPSDFNFPYEVEAGKTKRFALEEDGAEKQFLKVAGSAKRLSWLRRATFWVGVTTVAGKRKFVAADLALPWKLRPAWLRVEND
jgi:hypothetical protein